MTHKRLPEVKVRAPWHKSDSGCWSLSLGWRGCRVRVAQREPGGVFSRIVWLPGRGRNCGSLQTVDRAEAQRRASAFLESLVMGQEPSSREPLTLGELWTRYQQEAPGYRQNIERTRRQKQAEARLLLVGFGEAKRVDYLTRNDMERYIGMRKSGHGWPDGRSRVPVRARTIQGELKLLKTMIHWAISERLPDGSWLLESNPLRGVKLPKEESPRRPVTTFDRFLKIMKAVQELAATAPQDRGKERWKRFEVALVLAEATGARIGAIAGLRWSDISFNPPEITFQAEFDKRGRDRTVPIPEALAEELRGPKLRLAAVGNGWLFPCANEDAHWPREIFGELHARAEQHSGVPHLKGGRFHPYRRKWATERKHLPLVDVMGAGGWKDAQTYTTCYAHATAAGMLEVMSTPVKLRDRKMGSGT